MPIRTGKPTCQERSARTVVWRGFGKVLVARHDAQIEVEARHLVEEERNVFGRASPARARAGKARRPPFRPCHANARRSRLGRGHQYACGPFPSRSQLLSPSAMSGLPKPSMSR
jgi:hypothetical protein